MKKGIRKKIEWNLYTFDKHFLDPKGLEKEINVFTDFLYDWFLKHGLKVIKQGNQITCETTITTEKMAVAIWTKYICKQQGIIEANEFFEDDKVFKHNANIGLSDLAIHCAYNKLIYP